MRNSQPQRTMLYSQFTVLIPLLLPLPALAQPHPGSRSLPACTQVGQQVRLTLNTGTVGNVPTADPIWKVVLPTSITPFTTTPVNAPTLWLPNTLTEKWIQPASTGTPSGFPLTTYVYSTQFTTPVDPYLYGNIKVFGGIGADDAWVVKLNGVPLSSCPAGSTQATWCFHSFRAIGPSGLSTFNRFPGFLNTLTIEVRNTLSGSPSVLLVRADVIADCSKCTTPPPPPEPPCGGNPSTC